MREYSKARRENETPDQKRKRQEKDLERKKEALKNENTLKGWKEREKI